jgi:hypothetical protein
MSDGEHDDSGFEITHEEASWIGNRCFDLSYEILNVGISIE